jgi:hypothetical protein
MTKCNTTDDVFYTGRQVLKAEQCIVSISLPKSMAHVKLDEQEFKDVIHTLTTQELSPIATESTPAHKTLDFSELVNVSELKQKEAIVVSKREGDLVHLHVALVAFVLPPCYFVALSYQAHSHRLHLFTLTFTLIHLFALISLSQFFTHSFIHTLNSHEHILKVQKEKFF